jgi:hypothetical protein
MDRIQMVPMILEKVSFLQAVWLKHTNMTYPILYLQQTELSVAQGNSSGDGWGQGMSGLCGVKSE